MKKATLLLTALFCLIFSAQAQDFSASTNLMDYVSLGTINAELSAATGRHITLNVSARVNPWTYHTGDTDRQMQNRHQTYSFGVRYWPWHVYSGWWISGMAQYQEYNRGGVFSKKTEEGDAYGVSPGAGYSLMLHEKVNLDFGLSFWVGHKKYVSYACTSCGEITDKGAKWFVMPNEIRIAIAYIF